MAIHPGLDGKRWKRALRMGIVALGMAFAAAPLAASAHGNIWMDESVPQAERATAYERIVLYPFRDMSADELLPGAYPDWDDELAQRLGKRIKHTEFVRATAPYDAAAVSDADPNVDGYLVPRLRFQRERVDVSPATWTNVTVESYVNIDNGPYGSEYRRDWRSWPMTHVVPEMRRTLQMIDCDFTLYDARTHKKVLTLYDAYRNYDVDTDHAMEVIAKNFAGDWSRLKEKKRREAKAGTPTLSLEALTLPEDVAADPYAADTIAYAFRDEADVSLKHATLDDRADGGRYIAGGTIHAYEQGERWHDPFVSTTTRMDHSEWFTWYDNNSNAHTGTRTYYVTDVQDHPGGYAFYYHVNATLYLKDRLTGATVYTKTYDREDADRYANALHAMFGDFYREADERLGNT